jgi:energy-converting hydrogenase Eha subunit C
VEADYYSNLMGFFIEKTILAIYLLSGDYLYDRKLVRGFEGLVRATHNQNEPKKFQVDILSSVRSTIVNHPVRQTCNISDLESMLLQQLAADPYLNTNAAEPSSSFIFEMVIFLAYYVIRIFDEIVIVLFL